MKRSKIIFLLFLISLSMSLLGIFSDQDVVVSSTFTKVMEVTFVTLIIFIVLLILYYVLRKTFSQVKKLKPNQNKKDLTL